MLTISRRFPHTEPKFHLVSYVQALQLCRLSLDPSLKTLWSHENDSSTDQRPAACHRPAATQNDGVKLRGSQTRGGRHGSGRTCRYAYSIGIGRSWLGIVSPGVRKLSCTVLAVLHSWPTLQVWYGHQSFPGLGPGSRHGPCPPSFPCPWSALGKVQSPNRCPPSR